MGEFRVRRSWAVLLLALVCLVGGTNAAADDPPPLPTVGFAAGSNQTVTAPGDAITINLNVKLTSTDGAPTDGTTKVTYTFDDTSKSGNSGSGSITLKQDGSDSPGKIPVKVAGLDAGKITVTLKTDDNSTLADGGDTAVITVNAAPTVSVADKTVQGQPGPVKATLPVTLSDKAATDVVVDYTVNPQNILTNGKITIPAGDTSADIKFTVPGATKGGSFKVTLTKIETGNATLGDATATVTIKAAPIPQVAIQDATIKRTSRDQELDVPVTVSPASGVNPINITYTMEDGTAELGSDYQAFESQLSIPVGDTSGSIPVNIVGGSDGGTFTITLTAVSSNAQISRAKATITIQGAAQAPPTISIVGATFQSGGTTDRSVSLPISLSRATTDPVTVEYTPINGTAVNGSDFALTPGTATIPAGQTFTTIPATIKAGTTGGTFKVTISNVSGNATIGTATATYTISGVVVVTPKLSIAEATFASTSADQTGALTVTLSAASTSTVTVGYAAADGTAKNGKDYVLAPGTLTFTPGTLTRTIPVVIKAGSAGGTFTVALSTPSGATIDAANGSALVTIVNGPAISISDAVVFENVPGGKVNLTVTLVGNPKTPVTVSYATANGNAIAGTDYTAASGQLTFAVGETTKTIGIGILNNTHFDPDRTFTVSLSNATGATIARGSATVTIGDDESGLPTSGSGSVGFGQQIVGGPADTGPARQGANNSPGSNSNSDGPNNTAGTTKVLNDDSIVTKVGTTAAKLQLVALGTNVGANRLLKFKVTCPKTLTTKCVGAVTLNVAKTKTKKGAMIGKAKFTLRLGASSTIPLKLNASTAKLLAKKKTLKTLLTVSIGSGKSLSSATHALTLHWAVAKVTTVTSTPTKKAAPKKTTTPTKKTTTPKKPKDPTIIITPRD